MIRSPTSRTRFATRKQRPASTPSNHSHRELWALSKGRWLSASRLLLGLLPQRLARMQEAGVHLLGRRRWRRSQLVA
jgi:hypothetical protein